MIRADVNMTGTIKRSSTTRTDKNEKPYLSFVVNPPMIIFWANSEGGTTFWMPLVSLGQVIRSGILESPLPICLICCWVSLQDVQNPSA